MVSLASFALGILCQVFYMFGPEEPYIQQLSFMFIAMPSALSIVNHYYNHYQHPIDDSPPEERNTSIASRKRMQSNSPQNNVVADTSQHRRTDTGFDDQDILLN